LDVPLSLLDGCHPIALALPPGNVGLHLAHSTIFLVHLVTELAIALLVDRVVDQLQAARLPRPVLLIALLFEVPPLPVAAVPACLFEVAHGIVVGAGIIRGDERTRSGRGS
jgi:hypothetical protein